jgi:hypothetical protein
MTIKEGLKQLYNIHREFSKSSYDYTSFHKFFTERGFSKIDSTTIPSGHLQNTINAILLSLDYVADRFMNFDISSIDIHSDINLTKIIENQEIESKLHDLKFSFNKQKRHTEIWINLLDSKDITDVERDNLVILRNKMLQDSEKIISAIDYDSIFKTKLKMISSQLVLSRNSPLELDFLSKKFNLLKNDYPLNKSKLIIDLFEEYNKDYEYFIETSKELIEKQYPEEFNSMADKFLLTDLDNENKLQQFLMNLNNDIEIERTIEFSRSQKIETLHIFKDKSILIKNNQGEYSTVKDIHQLTALRDVAFLDGIDYTLRKKPTLNKFFKNKFIEDKDYNSCISAMISYKDNEVILKSHNFDINSFKKKSFESLDDSINAIVQKHKIEKFAKSILSGKYMDLLNENTFPYFETLYNEDFTTKDLQNYIGKKLAAIHTEEDFIVMLKKTVSSMNGFDLESILDKLNLYKIQPLLDENGVLTFEVDTYKKCTQFGPSAWCIVREEHYYSDYTGNGERQYISYNFNKDVNDIESVIGFTLREDGSLKAAHFKNDDEIYTEEEDISNIIQKTLYINQERHYLDDEKKKILESKFGNNEIKKNKLKVNL